MILVSACLLGLNCRYDGKNKYNKHIFELVKEGKAIALCPEILGGLSTPRPPSEIKNGKHVITKNGIDVTKNFYKGAEEVMNIVNKLGIKKAILQSLSPSCGCGQIYSGNFDGELVIGNGILTQMLIDNDIEVMNIDDYINNMEEE